jgi:hypothetical protein
MIGVMQQAFINIVNRNIHVERFYLVSPIVMEVLLPGTGKSVRYEG